MPVDGGAGMMRIFTGTPLCKPTPAASTGRCTVVSNLKKRPPQPTYHSNDEPSRRLVY